MSLWFICTESAEEMIKVKHRDTGMVIAPGDDNDSEEDIEVEEGMRDIVNYISLCVIHVWYTLYIYGARYTSMVHVIHLWYTLYIYGPRYTSMVHVIHLWYT